MLPSITWGFIDSLEDKEDKDTSYKKNSKLCGDKKKKKSSMIKFDPLFISTVEILKKVCVTPSYFSFTPEKSINWSELPHSVRPAGGNLPTDRCWRKIIQVQNMIDLIELLIVHCLKSKIDANNKIVFVEFCAGSGYLALPLAVLFPHVDFILVDLKEKSLDIAAIRIQNAALRNVRLMNCSINDFDEDFHIGVALHACGSATDETIQKCISQRAAFVVCSCCIGKIYHSRSSPRSQVFQTNLCETSYRNLIKAADFGHSELANYSAINRHRRICKCYMEEDRRLKCIECDYRCEMLLMQPPEASPKNDMLIGWPLEAESPFGDFSGKELRPVLATLEEHIFGVASRSRLPNE